MSMPDFFKLHIQNKTGATLPFSTDAPNNTFVITAKGWKRDSDGSLSWGAEQTLFAQPSADLTADSSVEGAEIDNSTDKYEGYFCRAALTTNATVSGYIAVFSEFPTDGSGGVYPSDSAGFIIQEDLTQVVQVKTATSNENRSKNFDL